MSLHLTLVFLYIFTIVLSYNSVKSQIHDFKCEVISIQQCNISNVLKDTVIPNQYKQSQKQVKSELKSYDKLIGCSQYLNIFLCTAYLPICMKKLGVYKPCYRLCHQVRRDCQHLISKLTLPRGADIFNCDNYPRNTSSIYCFYPSANLVHRVYDTPGSVHRYPSRYRRRYQFECPEELKVHKSKKYSVRVGDVTVENCGIPCNHPALFSQAERKFARYWILLWSGLCFASTLFTMTTFSIDRTRFRYPERPIIMISACYFMVSVVYLLGTILGSNASCDGPFIPENSPIPKHLFPKLITQGTTRFSCTLLFIIGYYFSMSGSIWWLVLTLAWFLSAGPKWSREAIELNSAYFHIAAWCISAVMTIALLAMRQVDGDDLSGTCFTGLSNDSTTLKWFILAPLSIYLILGLCLLAAGFFSLFRIRTVMKRDGNKTFQLEKLMMRIGVFGILYALPVAVVICCHGYESSQRPLWLQTWYSRVCRSYSIPCPRGTDLTSSPPPLAPALLRYSMGLVGGVVTCWWAWSGKTWQSWKAAYTRAKEGRRLGERADGAMGLRQEGARREGVGQEGLGPASMRYQVPIVTYSHPATQFNT